MAERETSRLLFPRARRWFLAMDALVLMALVAVVTVDDATVFFKVAFLLLTVAAFLWDPADYWRRAVAWGAMTSTAVVWAVAIGRAPPSELIDIVFFAAVLVLANVVNAERVQNASRLDGLLAVERTRTGELETLAELKADFTAMVVHEFGNPLAALRRLNELLRRDDLDPAARARALDSARSELGVLETLVADVSASAEVDRADFRVHPAPVPVGRLAGDIQAYGRSVCGTRSLEIDADDGDTEVLADEARIGQVLRNLVSNAVKYTPSDSHIRVRFAEGAGTVRINVTDDGPGIRDHESVRIFEPYYRSGTRGPTVPGSGLGLHISQRILAAHGAELTVASPPGRGACFSFELATVQAPEPDAEER